MGLDIKLYYEVSNKETETQEGILSVRQQLLRSKTETEKKKSGSG